MSKQPLRRQSLDQVLLWISDSLQAEYYSQIYREAGFKVQLVLGYQALRDALSVYRQLPVLIVISRFDRLQQLKSLQMLAPLASLLMLTPQQDLEAGLKMLEAGADGYLMQPVQPDELIAESRALLRHSRRILTHFGCSRPEQTARLGPFTLQRASYEIIFGDVKVKLNARQFKLLDYFGLHANQLIRRDQIAQVLDQGQKVASPRQLDNLVMSLRRVLPAHPDFVIETRYAEGYVLKLNKSVEN